MTYHAYTLEILERGVYLSTRSPTALTGSEAGSSCAPDYRSPRPWIAPLVSHPARRSPRLPLSASRLTGAVEFAEVGPPRRCESQPMTDLTCLVQTPGAHSMTYTDLAFPDRPLTLHAACPRVFDRQTPVLLVHHGVGRNGADYRDYWMKLVDAAGILAIAVEFSEAAFPDSSALPLRQPAQRRRHRQSAGAMDLRHRRTAVRRAARAGRHRAPALRLVRPFRRRAVRAPHAVVRLPRPRRHRGQRQCRHLRDAGPRHRVAVRPRRNRGRCRLRCDPARHFRSR